MIGVLSICCFLSQPVYKNWHSHVKSANLTIFVFLDHWVMIEHMNKTHETKKLKDIAIKVMIGSLIGSSGIAVIAVLLGSFSDTLTRALLTLFLAMLHSLASLGYIDVSNRSKGVSIPLFGNVIFGLLVSSFFVSLFWTWDLIDGDIGAKLYTSIVVLGFATLHADALYRMSRKTKLIDNLIKANYILMLIVISLIFPIIWFNESRFVDVYYRGLAAAGIIDATLTILSVVQYKLYLQKHPEENSSIFSYQEVVDADGKKVQVRLEDKRRRVSPLLVLLGIYLALQVLLSLIGALTS